MSIKQPTPSPLPDREGGNPWSFSCSPFLSREGGWGVRLLLFFLCLAVRLIALDSDPPSWLSWSTGLYTDEGFYTLDARHEVLFGAPAPGNFHDRLLSPLLSVLQQGVFSVFGVGIVQARLLSVLFGLLTAAALWLGLRRAYDVRTADFGALFLGLAPPFALYNRTALQETPTVFWLTLAFALWAFAGTASGRRQTALFALAGCFVGVAIVFKSLAALAVPALILTPGPEGPVYSEKGPPGLKKRFRECFRRPGGPFSFAGIAQPFRAGGLGLLVSLTVYAALWYGPHHAELSRMTTYYRVHQIQPHSLYGLWLNIRRGLIKGEHGVLPYLLATLPVPCLFAAWGLGRRRECMAADRFLMLWLGGGLLFCLLSSYAPSRYYVLFLPALMGLAARRLADLRPAVQSVALAAFLLVSAAWYGGAWAEQSNAQRDAGRELVRILPPGSVVIGDFAPRLCLNTPFPATTVQPGLANDDHPVERLHATHILVVRNAKNWQEWWHGHYPAIMQPSHRIASFAFGGSRRYVVDLYAVKEQE